MKANNQNSKVGKVEKPENLLFKSSVIFCRGKEWSSYTESQLSTEVLNDNAPPTSQCRMYDRLGRLTNSQVSTWTKSSVNHASIQRKVTIHIYYE